MGEETLTPTLSIKKGEGAFLLLGKEARGLG
jgi:hypothetical protein